MPDPSVLGPHLPLLASGLGTSLGHAAQSFVVIAPVELPDKTFIATLVLATRYRSLPVWLGVVAAFGVQCAVAVAAGGLLGLLPRLPVLLTAAAVFLVGAVVLWRGAASADAVEREQERAFERRTADAADGRPSFVRMAAISFVVLFAAEWGDLSQLLTAGLVVRLDDPVAVFVGAWLALAVIAGLAVLLGRTLLRRVSLGTVRRVGAGVCLVLAIITCVEAARL